MVSKRNPRVDGAVREAVAAIIEDEVADPRLAFVTIREVEVTQDLKHGTVYYSTLEPELVSGDPRRTRGDRIPEPHEVRAGLEAATSRIQGLLSQRVKLRNTPQLKFVPDPVVEQAARVDELLRQVRQDRDHG